MLHLFMGVSKLLLKMLILYIPNRLKAKFHTEISERLQRKTGEHPIALKLFKPKKEGMSFTKIIKKSRFQRKEWCRIIDNRASLHKALEVVGESAEIVEQVDKLQNDVPLTR